MDEIEVAAKHHYEEEYDTAKFPEWDALTDRERAAWRRFAITKMQKDPTPVAAPPRTGDDTALVDLRAELIAKSGYGRITSKHVSREDLRRWAGVIETALGLDDDTPRTGDDAEIANELDMDEIITDLYEIAGKIEGAGEWMPPDRLFITGFEADQWAKAIKAIAARLRDSRGGR